MTAAAFQATYSDWRLIKGRKQVQIVFEVPLEIADKAYAALGGMPDPSKSVWCAIARLEQEREVMPSVDSKQTSATSPRAVADNAPRGAKKWNEMLPSQQAWLLSRDQKFQRFVAELQWNQPIGSSVYVVDEDEAAEFIRTSCAVSSRSDILPGSNHAALWESLVSRFRAWERAPSAGAA